MSCFNRICASSTLSTCRACRKKHIVDKFQSHLRLIHPIHSKKLRLERARKVKFQSHLRLIHPIHGFTEIEPCGSRRVSIASAPHPPYPLDKDPKVSGKSIVSIASAPHPPSSTRCGDDERTPIHRFQSHLRLIHPIHPLLIRCQPRIYCVSIASAPHPPYPLFDSGSPL